MVCRLLVITLLSGCCWTPFHPVDDVMDDHSEPYQEEVIDIVTAMVEDYYGVDLSGVGFQIYWTNTVCSRGEYCVRDEDGEYSGKIFQHCNNIYVALPEKDQDIRNTALPHELIHAFQDHPGVPNDGNNHSLPVWVYLSNDIYAEIRGFLDNT